MRRLKNKIAEVIDMPMSTMGTYPFIEIEGNRAIVVNGCTEIILYESEKTVLKLSDISLTVNGEGLSMDTFGGNTVKLSGKLYGIEMTENDKERVK